MKIFNDLNKIIKDFLLTEGDISTRTTPDTLGVLQVVNELLNKIKPSSLRDLRYLGVAKAHISEVVRQVKKLNERVNLLEEENRTLKENKTKRK